MLDSEWFADFADAGVELGVGVSMAALVVRGEWRHVWSMVDSWRLRQLLLVTRVTTVVLFRPRFLYVTLSLCFYFFYLKGW